MTTRFRDLSPSGMRARALRVYCGYESQKNFAEKFLKVVSPGRWGNVERGNIPFSFRLIKIIKKKVPAIDTEWLRDGNEDKMPVGMLRELKAIMAKLSAEP